ncbi:Adhesion G protein-coupled receptor L3 [Holothuria leucospilota]|uniref:Adhesion G protein-coupled receptor L3 n=1 Tax=Holothuria leucospilota TaxID=206669 RepID=A0A9Q1CLA1_HOLLE|nr:Adhesion G protein-coupled receptor L3 [Holothuria leucospilota]
MVSKCPDSWNGTNECDVTKETSTITVGKLENNLSAIPVVSTDGVTFRNIYCAICHIEDPANLIPWSFEAEECLDTDLFETRSNFSIKDKVRYLIENCKAVSFLPPASHSYLFSTLIPCREVDQYVIDVCEHPTQNNTLAGKCSLIAAPLEFNGKSFKNKFCWNCSVKANVTLACKKVSAHPTIVHSLAFFPVRTPPLVPISITFDFGGQTGGVSISKEGDEIERTFITCKIGQVFDPFKSKCVHLACPDGYLLKDAVCLQKTSMNNNNDTVSCARFEIDVTLDLKNIDEAYCLSSLENVHECFLQDLKFLFTTNIQYNTASCQTGNNKSRLMFNTFSPSRDMIRSVLSSTAGVSNFSSTFSRFCSSIEFIEILAYCNSSQTGFAPECRSNWLSSKQWRFKENSTQDIVIKETLEVISLSEIKIKRYLNFSLDHNNSRSSEDVSIMRCNIYQGGNITCPFITLNASLFKPEIKNSNILVYKKNDSIRLTIGMYKLLSNGSIQVCNFFQRVGMVRYHFLPQYSNLEGIISTVGISLSIVGLFWTLVTYCLFSELRSLLANILIMTLCTCLIPAQVLLIFAGVAAGSSLLCGVVSSLGHFFWLATFTTSSVLGFDLSRTFGLRNQVLRPKTPSWSKVNVFVLFSFIPPSIISGTLMVLYFADAGQFGITYGSEGGCWIGGQAVNLIFFGIPVAVCLMLNLAFFLYVSLSIFIQKRDSERIMNNNSSKPRDMLIYVKIFVILGLTWTLGFVAEFTNYHFLWYAFTTLTSLHLPVFYCHPSHLGNVEKKVRPSYLEHLSSTLAISR